ncbi:MAG: type VI secretion system baseplate subunit TssF [Proteobacteria bacterium]|nr:type VI secretion system baseplate subunit TssF [Pseudomonadota bacterium]MBU1583467.1 type VI secretion system baseplate subunit TssF [Pseudomonadota bacterium]MBU2452310.1 type VI secretion system baseplate subunit TssF [Pseudomonadota bacterium]MBU2628468.1 type VI secretion system baseplate subunit TssF [Pseudomonadota bacterium]
MQMDEKLYRTFLEEMHELENFRMEYSARHPSTALDRDDPDVKRLVEALAFFAARTHMAGMNNIVSSRLRIFQQFFPFLLSPLPVMGMVQALPTGQFSETALFPNGSRVLLSSGKKNSASLRTLKELRILPVTLTQTTLLLRPDKGYRLVICLESMYDRTDPIGSIMVNIDHLNNYQASLLIFDALRTHLTNACVVFNKKADENSKGTPCNIIFGNTHEESENRKMHPLQEARFFFHFPQQDLFMTVDVPQITQAWKKITICMDLDPEWPKKIVINKDIFRLHTVPMENLTRDATAPFIYDGTKERFLIQHPEPDLGYALQSVLGVYKIENGGMVPLRAGILSGGQGSYEIEQKSDKLGRIRYWLMLHYSKAFLEPVTIVVDALWHQPALSKILSQQIKALPYSRNIPGVNWDLCESIVPHGENRFQENMDEFMHLLTIKNKSMLSYEDITALLQMLGSVWQGNFKPVKDLFYAIRVKQAPLAKGNAKGMLKLVYSLQFKECDPGMRPLVKTFTAQTGKILNAWISEAVVETRMEMDSV